MESLPRSVDTAWTVKVNPRSLGTAWTVVVPSTFCGSAWTVVVPSTFCGFGLWVWLGQLRSFPDSLVPSMLLVRLGLWWPPPLSRSLVSSSDCGNPFHVLCWTGVARPVSATFHVFLVFGFKVLRLGNGCPFHVLRVWLWHGVWQGRVVGWLVRLGLWHARLVQLGPWKEFWRSLGMALTVAWGMARQGGWLSRNALDCGTLCGFNLDDGTGWGMCGKAGWLDR